MTVVVRKHSTGADLVEITMLRQDYPASLLREQSAKVGELLRAPVRGLEVQGPGAADRQIAFVKAKFGTDGLIDRSAGTYALEPFARAFAGAPEPYTIQAMVISFQGEVAGEQTLRTYASKSVAVSGTQLRNPDVIEYRVRLLSQDPGRIAIPPRHESAPVKAAKPKASQGPPGWLLPVAVAVGSVAAGLLVYLLLLGPGRRTPRPPLRRRDPS